MNQRFQRDRYSSQKRQQRARSRRHEQLTQVAARCFHCEQLEQRVVLATIAVAPVADGFTQDDGPNGIVDNVVTNQTELQTQNLSASNKELRSELEFDLSDVVLGPAETITSVRLEVHTTIVLTSPDITIYGYTGDGSITAADHFETNTQIGFEQATAPSAATEFDLVTSFVEDFIGSPDELGILLTTSVDTAVNIVSTEETLATERPVLVIETEEATPEQLIDNIIADVDELVDNGLNKWLGYILKAKLKRANEFVADGDNNAAIHKLNHFNYFVEFLVYWGKISAADGQNLTNQADVVIDLLDGEPLLAPSNLSSTDLPASTVLSPSDLQPVTQQAITYWASTGISSAELSRLNAVTVSVVDIPGPFLGIARKDVIRIDSDAAGHGWHIAGGSLNGGIDLLTAVTHEFGHVLGYGHDHDDVFMSAQLSARAPRLAAIDVRSFGSLAGVSDMSADFGLRGAANDRVRTAAIQAIADRPSLLTGANHIVAKMTKKLRRSTVGHKRATEEHSLGESMAVDDEGALYEFFETFGRSKDI